MINLMMRLAWWDWDIRASHSYGHNSYGFQVWLYCFMLILYFMLGFDMISICNYLNFHLVNTCYKMLALQSYFIQLKCRCRCRCRCRSRCCLSCGCHSVIAITNAVIPFVIDNLFYILSFIWFQFYFDDDNDTLKLSL